MLMFCAPPLPLSHYSAAEATPYFKDLLSTSSVVALDKKSQISDCGKDYQPISDTSLITKMRTAFASMFGSLTCILGKLKKWADGIVGLPSNSIQFWSKKKK